jgi:hypothetical protein
MKKAVLLLFMLVQVGSMTYVNPEKIMSLQSTFGTRTTITMSSDDSTVVTLYSDWAIEKVIEALKPFVSKTQQGDK